MYTKILVPLDGSTTAEAVLPYVEALALGFRTAVEFLSVADVGAMTSHLAADKTHRADAVVAAEAKNSAAYLENIAKRFARISSQCRVLRGHAAEAILEAAAKDRNTLVAMATHGRSGAQRWLLGSVAEKVLRGTTNPLFLVRAGVAKTSPQRIINSIVVPLDGSALAEEILPTVSSWAQALDLEVTLIRAFQMPGAMYAGSEVYLPDYDELRKESHDEAAAYLKHQEVRLVKEGVRTVAIRTMEGTAADEIINFAHNETHALVAMSTHGYTGVKRWLLGSVTEKVVRHGDDPVLIVRGGRGE
ncbi:MAG: universal stress protein [Deltaproteobacteria bacterium]|nr:universal stress protein [Deltaproteobacteria bacterium]